MIESGYSVTYCVSNVCAIHSADAPPTDWRRVTSSVSNNGVSGATARSASNRHASNTRPTIVRTPGPQLRAAIRPPFRPPGSSLAHGPSPGPASIGAVPSPCPLAETHMTIPIGSVPVTISPLRCHPNDCDRVARDARRPDRVGDGSAVGTGSVYSGLPPCLPQNTRRRGQRRSTGRHQLTRLFSEQSLQHAHRADRIGRRLGRGMSVCPTQTYPRPENGRA